jgi:hypothetical protein
MSLEAATYISQLTSTNPLGTDTRAQGDDHIRLIKEVLQATFPNASKPFKLPSSLASQTDTYVVDESADGIVIPMNARAAARTVTLPAVPAYDGQQISVVKADHSFHTVTINGNGNNINGSSSIILHQRYQKVSLIWCAEVAEWFADLTQIPPIASLMFYAGGTLPTGYLFLAGGTIGSASSGATVLASASALGIYQHLWANFSNTLCPVTGGRGSTGLADFDANKPMALLDGRGRTLFGKDNMNGDAARLVTADGIDGDTLGASGGLGSENIAENQLPNITKSVAISTAAAHRHNTVRTGNSASPVDAVSDAVTAVGSSGGSGGSYELCASGNEPNICQSGAGGEHTHSGLTASLNGGVTQVSFKKLNPGMVQNLLIKI